MAAAQGNHLPVHRGRDLGQPQEPEEPADEQLIQPGGIRVDLEFAALIPPLSAAELGLLEESLKKEGLRDPLLLWKETGILLDGHNRLPICRELSIPLRVTYRSLADRESARAWILQTQLARRNLSAEAVSYLRGRQYLELRRQGFRSDRTPGQHDQKSTAQRMGREFRVGEKTIRRDARFALAVDEVVHHCGEEVRNHLLSRDLGLRRSQILRLARMKRDEQRCFLEQLRQTGRPPRRKTVGRKSVTLPTAPHAFVDLLLKRLSRPEATRIARILNDRLQHD